MNVVILSGNLTRDPEAKKAGSLFIMEGGIAVNERKKTDDGWKDVPGFYDWSMVGERAERLEPYLHKGMKVTIQGRLRYSQWLKDGQKRSKVDILVSDVDLPPKQKGEQKQEQKQDSFDLPF